MAKPLHIIVACSENRVIGRNGQLPWRIAEDWKFFKSKTAANTVILGRISFESWKSVLDDNRRAVVLTQNTALARERVNVVQSLNAAIACADALPGDDTIYICGGQKIFEEALTLPRVDRLYLTHVHAQLEGDRYFPDWHTAFPTIISQREAADENFRYTFKVLGR